LTRRRWWFLIALLSAAISVGSPVAPLASAAAPQAVESLDLRGYMARLDRLADSLANAHEQPAAISRLRESLPQAWSVAAGGMRIRVSTAWLSAALGNLAQNPGRAGVLSRQIELRLAAMRAAAADLETSPSPPSAEARKQLEEIFRRREFRGSEGPGAGELLAMRFVRWLLERIARLLNYLHVTARAGNVLAWVLIGAALLALGFWMVSSLARRSHAADLRIGPQVSPPGSRRWREEAQAAAERGDYRDAIHCAYWAAVSRLEDLQLLAPNPARTPRESLRLLDAHPREQTLLVDLTRLFEVIWYGFGPVSAADWSGARARLEQMECLSRSTAQTANS
jgi:Domain of unknown function (DUF4129)